MLELGKQVGNLSAHFAAIDNHIDRAMIEKKLAALEPFRQLLAHGLFDHSRTGKTDQGICVI